MRHQEIKHWKWKTQRHYDINFNDKVDQEVRELLGQAYKKLDCKNVYTFAKKLVYSRNSIDRWVKGGHMSNKAKEVLRSALV